MALSTMLLAMQIFVSPAAAGPDKRLDISDVVAVLDPAPAQEPDVLPVPVYRAPRTYPESARRDSLQGTVWVEAVVDQSGHVQDAKIKTGVRSDLDDAAINSVRQWLFKPASQKGKPINCTIVIPFHFKMKR
jgi:periplasmic protein TonB